MVSIVMPEIGLRAVVAIAFAATEVKKKEKSRVSAEADEDRRGATGRGSRRRRRRRASRARRPTRIVTIGMSRSVRSVRVRPRPGGTCAAAIENEPAMMRSDFRMPKMPAVAIAPDADEADVAAEDLRRRHLRRSGSAAG